LIREAWAKLLNDNDKSFFDWKNTNDVTDFLKNWKKSKLIEELEDRIISSKNIFV